MEYTLWEFLQSTIADGAKQLAGGAHYRQICIESVSVQELPVDNFIQKNELVLSIAVGCLDDPAAFQTLIRTVKEASAAALFLAFREPDYSVPPNVIACADSVGLPLFSIPWERRFSDIQTVVNNEIRSRKLSVYQQLQTTLFDAYFESSPIARAAALIGEAFHIPVVITDRNRCLMEQSGVIPHEGDQPQPLELEIRVGNILSGYLYLYANQNTPLPAALPESKTELLQKYICFPLSLWFDRKNIEDLTAMRLKNDFVWDLAHGTDVTESELLKQGARLHFNLNRPYTCVLLRAVPREKDKQLEEYSSAVAYASIEIENLLIQEGKQNHTGIMVASRNLEFILYLHNPSNAPEEAVECFLNRLHHLLVHTFPVYDFYWGVSEISLKTPDFPQLYQNAALALQYCLHSRDRHRFTYQDTKETQIFSVLSRNETIRQIAEEILAPLRNHREDSSVDLVETLSAFLHCNYNTSLTARTLHIHRQSLLYRLDKIKQLTGMSLDDHQNLFLLEISLRTFLMY